MSTGDKWEVVGKKGLKPEKLNSKENKKNKEKNVKAQPRGLIEESNTVFGALLEAEARRDAQLLGQLQSQNPNKAAIITSRPHLPIDKALANIEVGELERIYSIQKERNASDKEKWLTNVVVLLNNSFANIEYNQSNFSDEFPLCFVSSTVQNSIYEMISEYSDDNLKLILLQFVDLMYQAQMKDLTFVGYQVFMQILLKKKPNILLSNMDQFEVLMQRGSKSGSKGLCIMWMITQAGRNNLKQALTIWTRLLLPYLTVKIYSSSVINYVTNALKGDLQNGLGLISKADYFKVLSEIFARTTSLTPHLHQRLFKIYPQIRSLAWGDKSENLHTFFIGYLNRCTPDSSAEKIQEMLNCLVECLKCDDKSYDIWKKDYHKTISQSKLLLKRIELEGFAGINVTRLRSILLSIVQLGENSATQNIDHETNIHISKVLLNKSAGYSWIVKLSMFFFLLLGLLILAIALHPYIKNTSIYQNMPDYGIIKNFESAVSDIPSYLNLAGQKLGIVEKSGNFSLNFIQQKLYKLSDDVFELYKHLISLISPSLMSMGNWIISWLYPFLNWLADRVMAMAHEAQLLVDFMIMKSQPTLAYIRDLLVARLPVLLNIFDACMGSGLNFIKHTYDSTATFLNQSLQIGNISGDNFWKSLKILQLTISDKLSQMQLWIQDKLF